MIVLTPKSAEKGERRGKSGLQSGLLEEKEGGEGKFDDHQNSVNVVRVRPPALFKLVSA